MRKKVLLPFAEEPLLTAYHSNAFPLGIVQANAKKDLTPWLCCKYINCYYADRMSKNKFDISTSDPWFTDEGVLQHEAIDLQWGNYALLGLDVLPMLRKMLAAGYYVRGLYDERYIPGKSAYGMHSHIHDFLLFGYHNPQNVFFSVGYTDRGKFERYEIPYDCFYQSIACRAGRQITFDFYRFRPDANLVFNMLRVYRGLNDYLKSKNYEKELRKGRVFDMAAVRQLKHLFARTYRQEGAIDSRYTRLLMEHKYLMAERMKYLYREGYFGNDFAVTASENVYENAKRVHLLGIKTNMTGDARTAEHVLQRMQAILEEEKGYLCKAVELVHTIVETYWREHPAR